MGPFWGGIAYAFGKKLARDELDGNGASGSSNRSDFFCRTSAKSMVTGEDTTTLLPLFPRPDIWGSNGRLLHAPLNSGATASWLTKGIAAQISTVPKIAYYLVFTINPPKV
jgi:hypothetical protein